MNIRKINVYDDHLSKLLEKVNKKVPEPLPNLSFALLLLSARGNGKTTLLLNLLLEGYRGIFHNIFVFSPTINSDEKWKAIKLSDEKKFEVYTDEYLQSIIDYQEMEENKNKVALIIMDDCVGMFSRTSLINSFITKARWYRISLIFSVQYTKALSPLMRANFTSAIILGNSFKQEELKKIDEILPNDFDAYYSELKKKGVSRYNFIYINYEKPKQVMFNFTDKILMADGTLKDSPEIIQD